MNNELFTKIIALLKRRSFVQLVKEEVSGTTYSYGPAGTLLRRNIAQCWWEWMMTCQENTFPVESTNSQDSSWDHFLDISKQLEWNLPFSITQSRSYIHTPASSHIDKFLFNSSRKTSLVMQNICSATSVNPMLDSAIRTRLKWWKQFSGNPAKFSVTDLQKTESGYYANIQYTFPWGKDDVETVTSLGDTPLQPFRETLLSEHQFVNGKKKSLPCVIECNAVLEQGFLAFLLDAYPAYHGPSNNNTKEYACLQLNPRLTPYKMAVCYQGDKSMVLQQLAANIGKNLRQAGIITLNQVSNSSLEKRISQNDEMGIPYTAILHDSVLEAGVVEVRSRDTTIKEQIHISQLAEFVQKRVAASS
ncbi:DNA polymerase subunit gamma-2, mitochondrial-like [Ylistrum balloti]|uniref:DNA polymerase subunit gamma-2, mitochondrial-like n=1 Tax=Ylistrum balloti TaxID=509963 RepID=UPI002905E323|nr:DNA polymerase subunit gamma-2, mitochondrial-like [Ylistrum balloti]